MELNLFFPISYLEKLFLGRQFKIKTKKCKTRNKRKITFFTSPLPQVNLEAGLSLGKSHHVIDVANLVKSFFRELPDPLIPSSLQETLLRSLLIGENHIKAILLTCLLLPPLTINTLAFFMQFLHTVSQSSHLNKMSIENLAIIFTPGIMPFSDITSHRFNNHVKMVQLLIENAYSIGTIPDCIINKLEIHEVISNTPSKSRSFEALEIVTQKKKKKRRSGSLTRNCI